MVVGVQVVTLLGRIVTHRKVTYARTSVDAHAFCGEARSTREPARDGTAHMSVNAHGFRTVTGGVHGFQWAIIAMNVHTML